MAKSRRAIRPGRSSSAAFCPTEETSRHGFITRSETGGLLVRVHEVHHLDHRIVRVVTHFGNGASREVLYFEGLIEIEEPNTQTIFRPRTDPGAMFPIEVGATHELIFDVSAPGESPYVMHRRYQASKKLRVRLGPCEYQALQVDQKGWNAPYGPADMGAMIYAPALKFVVGMTMGRHGNVTAPRTLAPLSDLPTALAELRRDYVKDMKIKGYT